MVRTKLAAVATAGTLAIGSLIAGAGTASASHHGMPDAAKPASSGDCLYVLNTSGYRTTAARAEACNTGASDVWGAVIFCTIGLQETGVRSYVAGVACNAAQD
ncbi:hypothetical protein [Streptomyces sp. NBC_00258]|uniref:hypothetical protein n=1 Tax=Streptomyces sp. NBC_00258 TaxID=2903642 RepID=UPI002E2956AB|nr:hypothetical protein [Streptomyces sp. NBC_00258]